MQLTQEITMFVSVFCLFLLLLLNLQAAEVAQLKPQDECEIAPCGNQAPPIRFPFWLKGRQPQHCGSPGFALSCTHNNQTLMELPAGVKLLVQSIDYKAQSFQLYDPDGCLPSLLPTLNLSASPFALNTQAYSRPLENYTFFSCSKDPAMPDHPVKTFDSAYITIGCLDNTNRSRVQAVPDDYFYIRHVAMVNCSRITNMFSVPRDILSKGRKYLHLNWSKPHCQLCEEQRQRCRLKTDDGNIESGTECFGSIKQSKGDTKWLKVTEITSLSLFLGLSVAVLCYLHRVYKRGKECRQKLRHFLHDYGARNPSRYSYADIKRITDQFKEKLGQGAYGTVYKGRLSSDVLVAVKLLNNFNGNGEQFINEVTCMCRIHHINITRLAGFCADGDHGALIYEYLPNESLEKFIFTNKTANNRLLSWEKLHDIAIGVAKGIEYLHQGCEQQILHFDIKPHNILLDQNFIPKISDFGLAKLCSKDQSAVSMTAARGTMGYIAPEVLSRNFGNVSHKSDVYSYGMLLLAMVAGRKNVDVAAERSSQVYFPEWVYSRLEKGEDIGISIEEEERSEMAKKLTVIGLWCIQWHPVDRPSMKLVVQMLEGEACNLELPPNPFPSTDAMRMVTTMAKEPFQREKLQVIAE